MLVVALGLSGCAGWRPSGVTVSGYGLAVGVQFQRTLQDEKQIAAYVAAQREKR